MILYIFPQSTYIFQVLCNQNYHDTSHTHTHKKPATTLNKSENLYFSDNDNKPMTGEQIGLSLSQWLNCHNKGDPCTVHPKQCGRPYGINQMEKKDFKLL